MLKSGLFAFVLLFFFNDALAAKIQDRKYAPVFHQCLTRGQSTNKWSACIYVYPNRSDKVLYYFNGIGGNQLTWRDSEFERAIVKHWIDSGDKPPIVITISFEAFLLHKLIWFAVEKNSSRFSGKLEKITQEIMPLVRSKWFSNLEVEENLLMGVSMGAFNATQLYFKMPGFFSKAALICTPASIVSPFEHKSMVDRYIRRTNADPKMAKFALGVARDYMPTSADWERNSPISLAMRELSPESAPIYVANGTNDLFGFDEGDIIFARFAATKGAPITARFYSGRDHCGVEPKPIADFFTGIGESPRTWDEIDIFAPPPADVMKYFAL